MGGERFFFVVASRPFDLLKKHALRTRRSACQPSQQNTTYRWSSTRLRPPWGQSLCAGGNTHQARKKQKKKLRSAFLSLQLFFFLSFHPKNSNFKGARPTHACRGPTKPLQPCLTSECRAGGWWLVEPPLRRAQPPRLPGPRPSAPCTLPLLVRPPQHELSGRTHPPATARGRRERRRRPDLRAAAQQCCGGAAGWSGGRGAGPIGPRRPRGACA